MITALVVGDWSNDGHGKTHTVIVKHNLTEAGLSEAYRLGSLKLGILVNRLDYNEQVRKQVVCEDVMSLVAADYEDSSIPSSVAEILMMQGIIPNVWDGEKWVGDTDGIYAYYKSENEYSFENGSDDFAALWMEIARLGNPSLEWSPSKMHTLNIGGYGMLS